MAMRAMNSDRVRALLSNAADRLEEAAQAERAYANAAAQIKEGEEAKAAAEKRTLECRELAEKARADLRDEGYFDDV